MVWFNIGKAKPFATPLASHFMLSLQQCPAYEKEKEEMAMVLYSSTFGSLMYVIVCTRQNITHTVNIVSIHLSNLGKEHQNAVKQILRYLKDTSKISLNFRSGKLELIGYTNVNGAITWQSKLQKFIALSTTKTKFTVTTKACKNM